MQARTKQRILVGSGNYFEPLTSLVVPEPTPSGTLNTGSLGVHLILQVLERSEILLNLLLEGRVGVELGLS